MQQLGLHRLILGTLTCIMHSKSVLCWAKQNTNSVGHNTWLVQSRLKNRGNGNQEAKNCKLNLKGEAAKVKRCISSVRADTVQQAFFNAHQAYKPTRYSVS